MVSAGYPVWYAYGVSRGVISISYGLRTDLLTDFQSVSGTPPSKQNDEGDNDDGENIYNDLVQELQTPPPAYEDDGSEKDSELQESDNGLDDDDDDDNVQVLVLCKRRCCNDDDNVKITAEDIQKFVQEQT